MKNINEMTYRELVDEIQYVASILNDQPYQHDAYLADLTAALCEKSAEYMTGIPA